MAQTEEEVDKGEDGAVEGDDRDKEGEQGGGLLAISLTPPGEEETAGLVLKPDAGVKSMGQRKGGAEVRQGVTVVLKSMPEKLGPGINLQSGELQPQVNASVWHLPGFLSNTSNELLKYSTDCFLPF